ELFRYTEKISEEESAAFVALLLAAAQHPDIYVILTMRTDFLGHCAQFEKLPEAISQGLYLTPKMDRYQLQEAIEGPAEMFEGEVEPSLVNRMLNDLSGQQDQLPLLQHCLMRLWHQARTQGETAPCLTLEAYEKLGGLRHALSDHASEAYAELNPIQKRQAKIMFQALTEQDGGSDIRRPETVGTIAEILNQDWQVLLPVIAAFRRRGRNFITVSNPSIQFSETRQKDDLNQETLLDISHESLIRQWKALQKWAKEETQSAEMYLRLTDKTERYLRKEAELLRGVELAVFLRWRKDQQPTAAWAGRYGGDFQAAMGFLEQSRQEEEAKQLREKKRRRRTIGMLVAGLVLVSGLAGVSFFHWQQAKKSQELAEKQKKLAIGIIEKFTLDIPSMLSDIPGTDLVIQDIFRSNLADLKNIYKLSGDDIDSLRTQAYNLSNIASSWESFSEDTRKTIDMHQDALEIFKKIAKVEPKNTGPQIDLIIGYARLANAKLISARTKEALILHNQALEIANHLAVSDPKNDQMQGNLAEAYSSLGTATFAFGKEKEALKLHYQALEIREHLVDATPNDNYWQQDLASSYERVGTIELALYKNEEALRRFHQFLEVSAHLAAADLKNTDKQQNLALSHERVGDTELILGRKKEALNQYYQALKIRERLAHADIESIRKQKNLAMSYWRIGNVEFTIGETKNALKLYHQALKICEPIAAIAPDYVYVQKILCLIYDGLGSAELHRGRKEEALKRYHQALDIRKHLNDIDSGNIQVQQALASSYQSVGDAESKLDRKKKALKSYQQSLAILQRICSADP
ncbi:MAG: tetratricopeptide repeat protein, partial [Candidatus Electrothrix sp. AX5]|nr:tetratricopeptide repeat protein [Candidatus Electrothrix sp. AX5]